MSARTVRVFEGDAHYVEHGRGPMPILCLHGNSSSGEAFARLAEGLPPAFRLICVDFPGHGRSSAAATYRGYCSFQGLARFVVELTNVLAIAPIAIVGHSMGGHVAIQLLPSLPSLQAVMLISSPPIAGAGSLPRFFRTDAPTELIFANHLTEVQVQDLAHAFAHTNPAALAQIEADLRRTDGAFRQELGASLRSAEVEDELSIIRAAPGVKIALLGGLEDRFIERSYYGWVADQIGLDRQDSLGIHGAGHYPHLEAPRDTHALFQRFLKRIDVDGVAAERL